MTLTTERQQFAEQNEMSMDFVNWFFDEKKESFGNMWFLMAAAMWEAWKGRANREAQPVAWAVFADNGNIRIWSTDKGITENVGVPVPLYTAPPAPAGEVVVTRNERGDIVAVTRQDGEGRVIEVIDESNAPPAPAVPDEISSAIRYLKDTLVACNRFNYCADAVQRVENACRAAMLAAAPEGGNG
ncbi:hypothetical protein JY476_07335 [Serratia marcescens]|nr:hypothetical protein [Serratia marcescens]